MFAEGIGAESGCSGKSVSLMLGLALASMCPLLYVWWEPVAAGDTNMTSLPLKARTLPASQEAVWPNSYHRAQHRVVSL